MIALGMILLVAAALVLITAMETDAISTRWPSEPKPRAEEPGVFRFYMYLFGAVAAVGTILLAVGLILS